MGFAFTHINKIRFDKKIWRKSIFYFYCQCNKINISKSLNQAFVNEVAETTQIKTKYVKLSLNQAFVNEVAETEH